LTNIEITIVQPENYIYSLTFAEVMESLAYGFQALGYHIYLTRNHVSMDIPTVVLGANLLSPDTLSQLPAHTIIYNLEQVNGNSPWITPAWVSTVKGKILWDYSLQNIKYWNRQELPAHYVPIGYAPPLSRINRNIYKDIDVVFYGSINKRRTLVLEALKQHNLTVASLTGVYGTARDNVIARSKLALNIHFYVPNIFEIVRASYLVANHVPVLSERNADTYVASAWEELAYWSPYDMLVDRCLELLRESDLENLSHGQFDSFALQRIEPILNHAMHETLL
jgi:hypothetical protein